jgi:hypothetical protein
MQKIAGYNAWEWKVAGAIGVLGLVGFFYLFASRGASPSTPEKSTSAAESKVAAARGSALLNCQRAIKRASRDPESANVPAVSPLKEGADWRFLWSPNTQQVRVRNGLGLEVAVGAFCVVDEVTGNIKLLTLDGVQLITPGSTS